MLGHHDPTAIFYSDASAYARGGQVFFIDRTEFDLYSTAFSSREIELDSNSRELLGILYGLRAFKRHLKNSVVQFFTDNQNAATNCGKGSTSLRLHQLALDIFCFCLQSNIIFQVHWISRSLNVYADNISRIIDHDDWSITSEFYVLFTK